MSYFRENFLTKMKTNPVLNQVFQDPHAKRYQYKAFTNVRPTAVAAAKPDGPDRGDPDDWEYDAKIADFDETEPNVHKAVFEERINKGPRTAERILLDKADESTVYDDANLYWENMAPPSFYKLSSVIIHDNPQLKKITSVKILS